MKETLSKQPVSVNDPDALWSFAAPVGTQLETVLMSLPAILAYSLISTLQSRSLSSQCMCKPVQKHHETCLILAQAMFIGFSFCKTPNSLQGLQNQLFPVFTLLTIFSNFCQQIMPYFVTQRDLYEVRERLSKTSSWKMFTVKHPSRDSLESSHGCARLYRLVLPHRTAPECRGGRSGSRKRSTDVLVYSDVHDLRWDVYEYGYCGD